ncbi:hypothetical protein BS17DRAFT_481969 [Gyrodon lividus]|nr:hypothetical protein BS17DRAFT_481969 [Gyrodon lividus]
MINRITASMHSRPPVAMLLSLGSDFSLIALSLSRITPSLIVALHIPRFYRSFSIARSRTSYKPFTPLLLIQLARVIHCLKCRLIMINTIHGLSTYICMKLRSLAISSTVGYQQTVMN